MPQKELQIYTILISQLYFNKAGGQKGKTVEVEMSQCFPRPVFFMVEAGGNTKRYGEILLMVKHFAY